MKEQGEIKWFSEDKGFGYIAREAGRDAFFTHHDVLGEGYIVFSQGERVEFEVVEGAKGPHAKFVVKISEDTA